MHAGGHAISLAAESRLKLAGAIALCPYAGGLPLVWGTGLLLTIMYALLDVVAQAFGSGFPIDGPATERMRRTRRSGRDDCPALGTRHVGSRRGFRVSATVTNHFDVYRGFMRNACVLARAGRARSGEGRVRVEGVIRCAFGCHCVQPGNADLQAVSSFVSQIMVSSVPCSYSFSKLTTVPCSDTEPTNFSLRGEGSAGN
jgi:hypothetical protein